MRCRCGENNNYERDVWAHYVGCVISNQFLYSEFYVLTCHGCPIFFFVCMEYLVGRQTTVKRGKPINKKDHQASFTLFTVL